MKLLRSETFQVLKLIGLTVTMVLILWTTIVACIAEKFHQTALIFRLCRRQSDKRPDDFLSQHSEKLNFFPIFENVLYKHKVTCYVNVVKCKKYRMFEENRF